MLIFEWDEDKNRANIKKHRISFEEASTIFQDDKCVFERDVEHSEAEDRYIAIGCIQGKILVVYVVFTERGEALRLISARRATRQEKEAYYGVSKS
jgi:uncharacterized DUF497 family protein